MKKRLYLSKFLIVNSGCVFLNQRQNAERYSQKQFVGNDGNISHLPGCIPTRYENEISQSEDLSPT